MRSSLMVSIFSVMSIRIIDCGIMNRFLDCS